MALDTKYLCETTTTADKTGLVVWALVKSVVFTAIVMGAGYQLFFEYPNVNSALYPHMAVFIAVATVTFTALIYISHKTMFANLLNESFVDEVRGGLIGIAAIIAGIAIMALELLFSPLIIPFILWVGAFPIIPMLVVTYLIKDYFPTDPLRQVVAGLSLGYALGVLMRIAGVVAVVLIDSFGLPFVLAGACVEIASFAWYLYNDAMEWIEENKKHDPTQARRKIEVK